MITLLKKSEFIKNIWKNGQGNTLQIAIFPDDAEISKNNFLWRISSATVNSPCPFSLFLGFDRQLIVWKGQGLILNSTPLFPYVPLTFSGDTDIQCELINNEKVIDLGVIYDRNKIQSKLFVQKLLNNSIIELEPGSHFIFLAEGTLCLIEDKEMENGDSLRVENDQTKHLQIQTHSEVIFFIISLKLIYSANDPLFTASNKLV